MTDPRVAPVEDNLLSFLDAMVRLPGFELEPADDVVAGYSDVPFPLFNPVSGARFAPDVAGDRTRQLVAGYVGRGLPFMWWVSPSTTSPELEAALEDAGMGREEIPGMHVALDAPVTPPAERCRTGRGRDAPPPATVHHDDGRGLRNARGARR